MFKMFQWVQVSETDQVAVLHILTKIDISQTWHNTSRKNLRVILKIESLHYQL